MNIADRIQYLRKTKGLSQEELADKIGVSRQSVSKWESEQSVPDIEKIIILSDIFEVSTDYLLKGIENEEKHRIEDVNKLSYSLAVIVSLITGVLAYGANMFRNDEIFIMMIFGAIIGYALSIIISTIIKVFTKK